MPTGTYEHPLLGHVKFKTRSPDWVRGDKIIFTSGFEPSTDVREVHIPQLAGVNGANGGRFPFHARAHGQLIAAFKELEARDLLSHIKRFGGGFNPRLRKPTSGKLSKLPSNHAFGLAIDINPNDGSNGGTAAPLEPVFTAHGFLWGQVFNDPMHFEVRRFTAALGGLGQRGAGGGWSSVFDGGGDSARLAELSDFIDRQARHFPHGLRSLKLDSGPGGFLSLELKGADAGPPDRIGELEPFSAPLSYDQVVAHIGKNNKCDVVSTELLTALIWKESGFVADAKSATTSATGLMQMTKDAVKDVNANTPPGVHYTHAEMTDPEKNIQCGSYYLGMRIKRAGGDVEKGLDGFGTGTGYAKNILACETCLKAGPAKPQDCLNAIHP